MQFSQNAGFDKLTNSLFVSEIESDCGDRGLILENKKILHLPFPCKI